MDLPGRRRTREVGVGGVMHRAYRKKESSLKKRKPARTKMVMKILLY